MTNKTFAIIKPDAVKNNYTGKIYNHILESGFKILSAKLIRMSKNQAEHFYMVHKERPFYGELTDFMSSGRCMVLALQKENAVSEWRKTIGSTNPDDADDGTTSTRPTKRVRHEARATCSGPAVYDPTTHAYEGHHEEGF